MHSLNEETICQTCGGTLGSGPFGLRCSRCILSMVEESADEQDAYLAELFPELRLQDKLAQGGFGAVWKAEHRRMRRPVALKFLDSILARQPEAVALFQQEMVSVGGLDHPGIVRAHDAGERDGHWYIIMEYMDGLDCGALLRKHGNLPVAEACEIIRQAALGLHYAHGKGLVHRDVKPGNIMIVWGDQGKEQTEVQVKVLDFGLAGLSVAPVFAQPTAAGSSTLFLGTLEYISPEQIEEPSTVDARADVYSLGATLWRLISGKPPHGNVYPEMSLYLAMKRIATEPVPSLGSVRPDVPRPLVRLCDAMLSPEKENRPASAAEVAQMLAPWCAGAELRRLFTEGPLEEKPFLFPKANRKPLWPAVAGVVAAAGIGAGMYLKTTEPREPPFQPLLPRSYIQELKISEETVPRLFSTEWEVEEAIVDTAHKQVGRIAPDGSVFYVDKLNQDQIRCWRSGETSSAVVFPEAISQLEGLAISPDNHILWPMPMDRKGLHIGRARPDGTLLPPLTYNFGEEFSAEFIEKIKPIAKLAGIPLEGSPSQMYAQGRQFLLKLNLPFALSDGEPRAFSFITAGNEPPNTGLQAGDVLVADWGDRRFTEGLKEAAQTELYGQLAPMLASVSEVRSIPGIWRFRLDSDAPLQRLAKRKGHCDDITTSKHGVFVFSCDVTDPIARWDLNGWHPCVLDKPLLTPGGITVDPLSGDLYVICGYDSQVLGTERQSVQRLRSLGNDRYAVETFASRLGRAGLRGISISHDGQRMCITDEGNMIIVVLKRKGAPPLLKNEATSKQNSSLEFTGWHNTSLLPHSSHFTSPHFYQEGKVVYCTNRLRITSVSGGEATDFLTTATHDHATFCGVSPLTGDMTWTHMSNKLQPTIRRATSENLLLAPLNFADAAPPEPRGFAFITENSLPSGSTLLRAGDVLLAGSRQPQSPDSTSGVWRFRFDDDSPVARLLAVEAAMVSAVTVSKAGVFMLTENGILRWDGTTAHPLTLSQPLSTEGKALAADPLTSDIYVLEKRRLLRLHPNGPNQYTTEVLSESIVQGVPSGLCFSEDGKRLLLGDFGRKRTWVMERN